MAATEEKTEPTTNVPTLDALRARYPHVRQPILVALSLLVEAPGITAEDAKTKAKAIGTRITAASITAAKRLLERMNTEAPVPAATPAATRPARRPRAAEPTQDTDGLVRGLVAKLEAQGNAEAERLRNAMRRAIDLLSAALT